MFYTGKETANQSRKFSPFPADIIKQLSGHDFRLLEELSFLSRSQAKRSPTGARYCCPSEKYLAGKINLERANVSRHIAKLEKLGILSVTHRRPVRGHWRTNLYKIISWKWWKFSGLLKKATPTPHRVSRPTHLANPKREIVAPHYAEGLRSDLKSLLERWRSRAPE